MNKQFKAVCQNCSYEIVINGFPDPGESTTSVNTQCPDCHGWDFKLIKSLVVPQLPEELRNG